MSDMQRARKAVTISDRVSSISGERSALQPASWEAVAQTSGSDEKTKNYEVPEELIELARANLAQRAPARAPYAAKPTLAIPIVVPPAAIPDGKRPTTPAPPMGPVSIAPPVSTLKAKVAPAYADLARTSSVPPNRNTSRRPPPFESSLRPPPLESSLRPAPPLDEATLDSQPSPLRYYAPFLTAAVIVSAYVALCYFANTLVTWLP